jgi:hypothetical protein
VSVTRRVSCEAETIHAGPRTDVQVGNMLIRVQAAWYGVTHLLKAGA